MTFNFDRDVWDKRGWHVFNAMLFLYGLLMNIYIVAVYACHDCIPYVAQANYVAPWLLIIGIVFLVMSFLESRVLWLWLLPGLLVFLLWYGPLFVPEDSESADNIELRVVTWNTLKTDDAEEASTDVIRNLEADIVVLQEVDNALRDNVQAELSEQYPYQIYDIPQDREYEGMAILSRYEIVADEVLRNPDPSEEVALDELIYMRAEIDVEGETIAVYNFHPPLPEMTPLIRFDDTLNWNHVEQFIEAAEADPLPVIMLCDCNIPPKSEQYARLDEFLNEAHADKGWSFGMTFMGFPNNAFGITHIDYVWYDSHFEALEMDVIDQAAESDHMPVWARLDFSPPAAPEQN